MVFNVGGSGLYANILYCLIVIEGTFFSMYVWEIRLKYTMESNGQTVIITAIKA